jgi:outer membrane protein
MRHPSTSLPALVVPLLLGLVLSGVAAQEPLSLEEAIALARSHNPGLQIVRSDEEVSDWDVRSARGSLLPSLSANSGLAWQGAGEQRFGSLTAGQLGFGDQPSFLFSTFNLGLDYTLSGRTLRAPARAEAMRSATRSRIRTAEAELVLEVTGRYLDLLRQSQEEALARQELARAEANLRLARAREAVGAATPLEVKQAEVQVGRAEVALLQAEQGIRIARLSLLQRMGTELDREIAPTTEFDLTPVPWTEEELFRRALDRSPRLEALRADESAADVEVAAARSAYFPSLSVQAGWSGFTRRANQSDFLLRQIEGQVDQQMAQCELQNELFRRLAEPLPAQDCTRFLLTPDQRDAVLAENRRFPFDLTRQPPQLSLTLSLPIFQGLDRQRQLEAARVERSNTRHRLREQELALRVEIAGLLAEARTAFQRVRMEEGNQELAQGQLRLARAEFEVGNIAFLQLAEAETVRAQADRDHVDAVFRYHETIARLEAAVGVGPGEL